MGISRNLKDTKVSELRLQGYFNLVVTEKGQVRFKSDGTEECIAKALIEVLKQSPDMVEMFEKVLKEVVKPKLTITQ